MIKVDIKNDIFAITEIYGREKIIAKELGTIVNCLLVEDVFSEEEIMGIVKKGLSKDFCKSKSVTKENVKSALEEVFKELENDINEVFGEDE